MESVGAVVLTQHCQMLGVQHRRSRACLGSLFGGVFPSPPFAQPDLDEWLGRGRFVKRSGQRHALVCARLRLACVGLEPLLHAGKRVVRASSTPISSAESAVHGTKAACKCRKLENGVSHRVPVLFVHPSALEPRPHGEIFLNFSASMALDCHVDIVFVRASSCCGLLR